MSLAFLKREKNFTAVLEKSYPRVPEEEFNTHFLFMRLSDEVNELEDALESFTWFTLEADLKIDITILEGAVDDSDLVDIHKAMLEVADVSNCADFIFEKLVRLEARARGGD